VQKAWAGSRMWRMRAFGQAGQIMNAAALLNKNSELQVMDEIG